MDPTPREIREWVWKHTHGVDDFLWAIAGAVTGALLTVIFLPEQAIDVTPGAILIVVAAAAVPPATRFLANLVRAPHGILRIQRDAARAEASALRTNADELRAFPVVVTSRLVIGWGRVPPSLREVYAVKFRDLQITNRSARAMSLEVALVFGPGGAGVVDRWPKTFDVPAQTTRQLPELAFGTFDRRTPGRPTDPELDAMDVRLILSDRLSGQRREFDARKLDPAYLWATGQAGEVPSPSPLAPLPPSAQGSAELPPRTG